MNQKPAMWLLARLELRIEREIICGSEVSGENLPIEGNDFESATQVFIEMGNMVKGDCLSE